MPPYHSNASKAQERKMFALANKGEISMDEAKGRARATNWKSIPERVGKKRVKKGRSRRR